MNEEEAKKIAQALRGLLSRNPDQDGNQRAINPLPDRDRDRTAFDEYEAEYRNGYGTGYDHHYQELRRETANALRRCPVQFALTVLGELYGSCLVVGDEQHARFIRTNVQRFLRGGRRYYYNKNSLLLGQFIDECVESKDIMDDETYNDYLDMYRGRGTVEALIESAGNYKQKRAGQVDLMTFAHQFKW